MVLIVFYCANCGNSFSEYFKSSLVRRIFKFKGGGWSRDKSFKKEEGTKGYNHSFVQKTMADLWKLSDLKNRSEIQVSC